jgi:hypothetical protein
LTPSRSEEREKIREIEKIEKNLGNPRKRKKTRICGIEKTRNTGYTIREIAYFSELINALERV